MQTVAARLLSHVEYEPNTGCWLWSGAQAPFGHGIMKVEGRRDYAHRVSFAVHKGGIPSGAVICHRCDTPQCVNPEHLFAGTQAENLRDMWAKGRAKPGRSAGEMNGRAKLTDQEVLQIRSLVLQGAKPREIAPGFGVTTDWVRRMTRAGGQQKRAA